MTDKELKKLKRSELLDILIYQTEQNRKLREELDSANSKLARRDIAIKKSGTMAEASVLISEVFESVDRAARFYLENIERRNRETENACKEIIAQAQRRADDIIAGAKQIADPGSNSENMIHSESETRSTESRESVS